MIGVGVGSVSIVGAGPGDPDLITVKALKRLRSADVIMYDHLVSEELLQYVSPRTMLVYCGKSPGHHAMPQDEINKRLIDYALEGKRVVRLKGGETPLCLDAEEKRRLSLLSEESLIRSFRGLLLRWVPRRCPIFL
ncbi:Uroporphyrinogen-III C-methyltransferase [compost metagenome]